ncbi:MAG: hypothetical protein D6677_01815 [Calditrichaeota bacterium]|nr:MAG: hypothetical protein D6677_01815 [Calditrichota bacterium]
MRIVWIVLISITFLFSGSLEEKLQQKVSPKFNGASITEVLKLFARQHALNLVVSGEVKGRVSVQLYNVTLASALNTILKSLGYHYIVKDGVILVKSFDKDVNGEKSTRVYALKYLNAFNLIPTLTPLLSAKGKLTPLLAEPEEKETEMRSNILVVNDLWENINAIDAVIKKLDVPKKQILIEVRLVETLVGNEEQYGLNLPKHVGVSMDGAELTAPISKSTGGGGNQRLLSAWYELPKAGDKLNLGVLNVDQLSLALDMLAKDNGSKLISNPRVMTLNNKKASIKIGTSVPIQEVNRGVGGDIITYREKDVNINVDVIPLINEDNRITLDVHPIMEEIVGYVGPSEAPQPITSKREVKTMVTVTDGQTLVLGGLVKESRNKTTEKVWLLGDIPILGYLFQNTTTKIEKSDLLIFITPKIVGYQSRTDK